MDTLTKSFEKKLLDLSIPLIVRVALQKALKVLDKYYSKTDESVMWKTVMRKFCCCLLSLCNAQFSSVLHPKYRRQYFVAQGWKDSWVDTAVSEARRIWTDHYKTTVKLPAPTSSGGLANEDNPFDDLDRPVLSTTIDPFDEFIMGTQNDDDAVDYWTKHLAVSYSPVITP